MTLTESHIDAGHLAHGYAIAAHKAQGATADRALVRGCDAMYCEWDYVAIPGCRSLSTGSARRS